MAENELRLLFVEETGALETTLVPLLAASGFPSVVDRADGPGELASRLGSPWDLVVADHGVPGWPGDRVIGLVHDRWPWLPVLVVVDRGGEALAVELMRRGAADVVSRSDLARVPTTLAAVLQDARQRQARTLAEAQAVRLGRLYRLRSETNRAIVRFEDPRSLVQEVCRLAHLLGSYAHVWVCHVGPLGLETWGAAGGPCAAWAESGDVVDLGQPRLDPALGWIVIPLRVDAEVWGCLGFQTAEGAILPEETSLLHDVADDIGYGLVARKREAQRRETEQFLTDMASLVPGVFYKLHQTGSGARFLYVSPGIDLLLPVSPAQVMADPTLVFGSFHPDDRRLVVRAGLRSRDSLTVFNLQFRLVRPNGATVCILATAFPQKHPDGTVVWTGLAIDVTPQNKLQEALKREQDLLAVILNNIGDGVVAVDGHGLLTLVNRTASQLLDQDLEAEGNRPWFDLDPGLPWHATERFTPWLRRRRDGTLLHLEAHATDLDDVGQGPRGRVMVLRDMTERERVADRLRQSEKLESIGLLAGGIAHDFNNLLTGVFGFIQLARMNADEGEKVVSYLDHALGPFQRARTLTQQLLTFAKGGEPTKVPLALPPLLTGIAQFTLGGSPVAWRVRASEPVWAVVANEAQVHQVFENLFLNAKQALGDAGGTLDVGFRNLPSPGPEGRGVVPGAYVEVVVEDDGPGIATDALPRVFDPFFTTKANGTGLGLSICFSVVKKHGGTIEVESVVGRGTRFRVFWPALAAGDPGSVSPVPPTGG